jgi:hypothetical protein
MSTRIFNADYFDFKQLAIDEKFIKTKVANTEYAFNTCIEAGQHNKNIGLITEAGYGVRTGIEDFRKRMRGYRQYFEVCSRNVGLMPILKRFVLMDLPKDVKITDTKYDYLVSAISYNFKHLNKKRKHIIILCNFENLPGLRQFGAIYKLTCEVKNRGGIVLSINGAKLADLHNKAKRHSDVRNFLGAFDWREMPPPSPEELGQHCFNRGVLGKRIIDRLLKKCFDFRVLNIEINKIREMLIKRGYITPPTI